MNLSSRLVYGTAALAVCYFARVAYVMRNSSNPTFDHVQRIAQEFDLSHCRTATSRPSLRLADKFIVPSCFIFATLFVCLGRYFGVTKNGSSTLTWRRVLCNIALLQVGPIIGACLRVMGTRPATLLPTEAFDVRHSLNTLVTLWKFSHPTDDLLLWTSHSLVLFCYLVQIWSPNWEVLMYIWASVALAFFGDIIGHLQSGAIPFCTRQAFMQQWDSSSIFHVFFHEYTAWMVNLYSVVVVS